MRLHYFFFILISIITIQCKPTDATQQENSLEINPAAEGFNHTDSDSRAIELADKVMEAMGGRSAYDSTRYIKWNFFNSRRHVWDKTTGDLVIEGIRDSFLVNMNINSMTGDANYHGVQLSKSDSLDKYIQKGKEMWINDAYWLVMPFKLKDSGVSLKYVGNDTLIGGRDAEVLSLTFDNVGVTPDNMYHVYVDKEDNLIKQWSFYTSSSDSTARFTTPWIDYKPHGSILLSGDRGPAYKITEIAVGDSLAHYFQGK